MKQTDSSSRTGSQSQPVASLSVAQAILVCLSAVFPLQRAAGQAIPTPPPPPDVKPLISTSYAEDSDGNHIDDALQGKVAQMMNALRAPTPFGVAPPTLAQLDSLVGVELVFTAPVTQQQINDFMAMGGQIDYLYKAVSYGWNGQIPLSQIAAMPAAMGATFVLVTESKPMTLHLDMATRTGRVRPVWAAGFAGSPTGFSGDSTITIAIVDTGVDSTHTDLAGRRVYWHDFSTDNMASPVDYIGHGSHVTGIALGTGAAGGSGTGTFHYTDTGDLTTVTSGYFYPSPINISSGLTTFVSKATWSGGGSTSLYQIYHPMGVAGNWYAMSGAATGSSPLTEMNTLVGSSPQAWSTALLSNGGTVQGYVITNTVTNYPGVGDGFNNFSGVAPGCRWAAAKVFTNSGTAYDTSINAAVDDLVANRVSLNIKVMNMSLGVVGSPGLDTTERQKVNTAANNGIVMAISAGNSGLASTAAQQEIGDPGRAAMAITAAAANDNNALTDYTSIGFSSPGSTPGQEEDYKPDVMAPGGSSYYTQILSVDTNSRDGSFSDQQANDYANLMGTSMASPFVAGCAALVIQAMQQNGVVWDFTSSQHSRYVKMVLCATASESNTSRESGSYNPTLERAAAGPSGYPQSKDPYEGYGLINADAAVEAVRQTYIVGTVASQTLGPGVTDKRVWGRTVNLTAGVAFVPTLIVPATGDFDLYLYSATPSAYGTPVILASSTNAGYGVNETFNFLPTTSGPALLAVKRVSGDGTFSLSSADAPPTASISLVTPPYAVWLDPATQTIQPNPDGPYIYEGWTVTMTATATEPNAGQTLTYLWTQSAGQPQTLTSPTALSTSFTVPARSLTSAANETMTFQFVATDSAVPPLSSSPVTVTLRCYLAGDIDHSNSVILFDLKLLVAAWDSSSASSNWNPAADLDGDGSVTLSDLKILVANWNRFF